VKDKWDVVYKFMTVKREKPRWFWYGSIVLTMVSTTFGVGLLLYLSIDDYRNRDKGNEA
jgi:hypothetical protein